MMSVKKVGQLCCVVGVGLLWPQVVAWGDTITDCGGGPCCSVGHCYGKGGGVYLSVTMHGDHALNGDTTYGNLTVAEDGRLDMHGYVLRVAGTLTNYGTIVNDSDGDITIYAYSFDNEDTISNPEPLTARAYGDVAVYYANLINEGSIVGETVTLLQDCNCNDVDDTLDIAWRTSEDCQGNGIPDECDIDSGDSEDCNLSFVPDDCELLADPDCNNNGTIDECELLYVACSDTLEPIGTGSPQSYTFSSPPEAAGVVRLIFLSAANLLNPDEFIYVDINGVPVGEVFVDDASDCPKIREVDGIDLTAEEFNAIVGGGNAEVNMVASTEVNPDPCDPTSCIRVCLAYPTYKRDCNGNGILDECERCKQPLLSTDSHECQPPPPMLEHADVPEPVDIEP